MYSTVCSWACRNGGRGLLTLTLTTIRPTLNLSIFNLELDRCPPAMSAERSALPPNYTSNFGFSSGQPSSEQASAESIRIRSNGFRFCFVLTGAQDLFVEEKVENEEGVDVGEMGKCNGIRDEVAGTLRSDMYRSKHGPDTHLTTTVTI